MKRLIVVTIFFSLFVLICSIEFAHAGPTRVGNGDDGGDLELPVTVKSGVLIETRAEAVKLLKRLNVAGMSGLGQLIPETEKTEILLVSRNVDLGKTQSSPEERSDALEEAKAIGAVNENNQPVYARTFPEPHAATRFFPAALLLERRQLVALHIHEALHRALPLALRENEQVVSRITLALTTQGASFDRVKDVVSHEVQREADAQTALAAKAAADKASASKTATVESAAASAASNPAVVNRTSLVEYSYRSFFLPESQKAQAPVSSLHSLRSFLYPFEGGSFGFGVEFTFVVLPERSYLGPLGLSSQLKLGRWGRSDIDLFAALHLNTLADGEIKNTPVGRDTATVGVAIQRESNNFRLENRLFFTGASDANQKINGVDYTYKFAAIFGARVLALGRTEISPSSVFEWGGMAEVLLANSHEVTGSGPLAEKTGRLRVVSIGPEFAYSAGDFRYSLSGRFIVDSTPGISLDQLGDLMGSGVGQGSWGGAVSWRF
ncbi:hypothetical protein BH10BDE1_BH10BDE1_34710 [soil metagenome]